MQVVHIVRQTVKSPETPPSPRSSLPLWADGLRFQDQFRVHIDLSEAGTHIERRLVSFHCRPHGGFKLYHTGPAGLLRSRRPFCGAASSDCYCYYDAPVNDWPLRGCATDDSVCIRKRSDVKKTNKKKKGSCEHNNLSPVVEVFNRSNCSVLYLLLNLIDQWLFFSVVAGCFDSVGRFLGKCQQRFLWYEEC